MRATTEVLEGNKVKLSVEVDEEEVQKAVDATLRRLAREAMIPGFRPGKVPRRLLEARLGPAKLRSEALRDVVPEYYERAISAEEIDAIAAPEIDITAGEETGPVVFDATVPIRPKVVVPGYSGLVVSVPSPFVTEEDIDAQIDRLRGQFGTLEEVDRPVARGDHVTIDVEGLREETPAEGGSTSESEDAGAADSSIQSGASPRERAGQATSGSLVVVEGLSSNDLVYEVGSGGLLPGIDDHLLGAEAGAEIVFGSEDLPNGATTLRVRLKQVRQKILPDATDEWAEEASEFSTLAELRADLATRLAEAKRRAAAAALEEATASALTDLVAEEMPEVLVTAELQVLIENFGRRLATQGLALDRYLKMTGQSSEQFIESLRAEAIRGVKLDLALRAVALAEGIEVAPEEVEEEIAKSAREAKVSPAELRRRLEQSGGLAQLRSDMTNARAAAWLVEHVSVVDGEGREVDRMALSESPQATASLQGGATAVTEGPAGGSTTDADEATTLKSDTAGHAHPDDSGSKVEL